MICNPNFAKYLDIFSFLTVTTAILYFILILILFRLVKFIAKKLMQGVKKEKKE